MKDCCIIIPVYNIDPTDGELLSIRRNLSVLKDYDVYFVHPLFMDVSAYESLAAEAVHLNEHIHFKQFNRKYFRSNKTYSRLLLSEEFYRPFLDYEYILIAQSDTYILNTDLNLDHFLRISREKSYDYWGAIWPEGPFGKPYTIKDRFKLAVVREPEKLRVGNGGFSLRHVVNTINLIRRRKNLIDFYWRFNEDMFFSWYAYVPYDRYKAASEKEAYDFALEENMREMIDKGHIPYAVHAWEKHYPELISRYTH